MKEEPVDNRFTWVFIFVKCEHS